MEKAKAAKAETGKDNPTHNVPAEGPLIGVIQAGAAGKGVEATPAKLANVPEKVYDMPPDPCEIGQHPQLGPVSHQILNCDHQVEIGAQEPYEPESLGIQWNALSVYEQNPMNLQRLTLALPLWVLLAARGEEVESLRITL